MQLGSRIDKCRTSALTAVSAYHRRIELSLSPVSLSLPNDNVLLVPNRNVLLTRARWGVGNGPTPDDTERARPAGCAEEGQKETDYAEASGGRDRGQRTAGTAHAGAPERVWRQGSDSRFARSTIKPENRRGETGQSDAHAEPRSVSGFWAYISGRVSGKEPQPAGRQGNAAWLDERRQVVAPANEARRKSPHLASAALPLRRTGAMGYQRTRLVGRPRSETVLDQHARRCDQSAVSALCNARFNRRKSASVAELSGQARKAVELLYRQGQSVYELAQEQTRRDSRERCAATATNPDRASAEGTRYRVDCRAFPAGQRTDRAWIWHSTRWSGEGLAGGGRQDARTSQCLSGSRVLTVVESNAHGGAGLLRRCTSPA